jgi:peptidoglycan/LPS O-acetylase OafA/YrhL
MHRKRLEIEGLRALAVVPVILFHIGVPGFSGGFVGVDVFFVISGYLITGILWRELQTGGPLIWPFYERRIRRILPALALVLLFTWLMGIVLLVPHQLVELGKSTLATAAFVSNFWLWRQSGYFAPTSEMLPLLHTWSLAVEEQFYIGLPILMVLFRRRPGWLFYVLCALFVGSFLLSCVGTTRSPAATFFLPATRAWELLAGSLLAIRPPPSSAAVRQISSITGLVLILIAVLGLNPSMDFPGLLALLPVLGAAAVIYGGGGSLGGRLLSFQPFVAIGAISYSLYLWHWPILVFCKQAAISKTLDIRWTVVVLALTLGASVLTYIFVEQPARRAAATRSRVFLVGGGSLIGAAVMGLALVLLHGLPARFDDVENRYLSAEISPAGKACINARPNCQIGTGEATFAVWGDSHAGALLPAFEQYANAAHTGGFLAARNSCPPLLVKATWLKGRDREDCERRNAVFTTDLQNNPSIKTVFLVGIWASYQFTRDDIAATVDQFHGKKVIWVGDNATPGFDVPWYLAESHRMGLNPISISRSEQDTRLLEQLSISGVQLFKLQDALCDTDRCLLTQEGNALYADENHLSEYAVKTKVGPKLVEWIQRSSLSSLP